MVAGWRPCPLDATHQLTVLPLAALVSEENMGPGLSCPEDVVFPNNKIQNTSVWSWANMPWANMSKSVESAELKAPLLRSHTWPLCCACLTQLKRAFRIGCKVNLGSGIVGMYQPQ